MPETEHRRHCASATVAAGTVAVGIVLSLQAEKAVAIAAHIVLLSPEGLQYRCWNRDSVIVPRIAIGIVPSLQR
jgi:hypothetical protein